MLIKDKMTILFQGDSITDAGRDKQNATSLGGGYVSLIAAFLAAQYPQLDINVINKGISGNRAADLKARWTEDAVNLKPDVVSIMIGINDTWRAFDRNDPTSADDYKKSYREILARLKSETNAAIVIIEPFVLPVPDDRKAWREDLDKKIIAARELAVEFGAIYIPLDGIFASYGAKKPYSVWAADGVHPSLFGSAVIAKAWLDAVGAL